jgi:predicted GIY-YIG superfamily endonuclease
MDLEFHVYILLCANGHYYVGCTSDLEERMVRHAKGLVHYTKDKLPVKCVADFSFPDKYKAFAFEKYLKSGSGRAFLKRHLIAWQT